MKLALVSKQSILNALHVAHYGGVHILTVERFAIRKSTIYSRWCFSLLKLPFRCSIATKFGMALHKGLLLPLVNFSAASRQLPPKVCG